MGKVTRGIFYFLATSAPLWAYKTDFTKNHAGLSLSAGYLKPSTGLSNFDPTRYLGQQPLYYFDTGREKYLNFRFGFFGDFTKGTFEIFASHLRNTSAHWSVGGTFAGEGQTRTTGWGGGFQISPHIYKKPKLRGSLNISVDYLNIGTQVKFGDGGPLKLGTKATTVGIGVRNEIWLGDLWILSTLASYQYSMPQAWSVKEGATLMGKSYSEGPLTSADGTAIKSRWGGYLVEVGLRLAFY